MALAILRLLAFENAKVRFNIDTGTNRYYQLKIGKNLRQRDGIDWIDEVFFATPMAINPAGGNLLSSSEDVFLPVSKFDQGTAYVQLFSFKTPDGKSPAFSRIVKVPMGLNLPSAVDLAPAFSLGASMNTTSSFQPARKVPCRSYTDVYARQASIEELLGSIIKIVTPTVIKLLNGEQNANPGQAGADGGGGKPDLLATLLNTILGSLSGKPVTAVSQPTSLNRFGAGDNRFTDSPSYRFSQPFIFGIDDALLGMLIGPVLQVLPQLVNAGNQERIQMRQADNKLVSDILADDNRRMMLEKLQEMQQKPPASAPPENTAELNQLLQLLQQAPPAVGQKPPVVASRAAQSLTLKRNHPSASLSKNALVSFTTAAPISWNGLQKVLFAKNKDLRLSLSLVVAGQAASAALPRAIIKLIFKDRSDQSLLYEKSFKQKDILPNNVMTFALSADELSHLPVNQPIAVFAEVRWLGPKSEQEFKALGSTEIILVNQYFLKEQGKDLGLERELTDMKRYRPFWNKIWEAPSQDLNGAKSGARKKYLWELDVTVKYSVLFTGQHETNGLMDTKLSLNRSDRQSLTEKIEGRMKAGTELSLHELNKLLPLWKNELPLRPEQLEAISTQPFVQNHACEFIDQLQLKGRARERGMIWVVPIFRLFELTLNTVGGTDESGQVVAVTEEQVRFPLPSSARVMGLKSQ